jgi:PPM family protein phosphatase
MFAVSKSIQAGGSELQDRAEFFWNGSNLILVLADGAGGLSGGAEAANFIIESVTKRIGSAVSKPQQLNEVLASLDQEMAASGAYGETTCVIVVASESGIVGTSVGDSGALLFSKAGAENLTAHQVRKPLLGSGRVIPVSFSHGFLDGTLLVASDGLLKYTSQEKIAAKILAADFESAASQLIDLVRYQSGALPDDVSVLLARQL